MTVNDDRDRDRDRDPDREAEETEPDEETPEEPIEDPLKRDEDVKFFKEERLLGVTIDGPKVGQRSIDVFLLAEFLEQLDRVVRGLTAWARGIPLELSGQIPRPPDAAPWRTRGLAWGNSATVEFVLGQPEALRLDETGALSSPTLDAIIQLGHVVRLDASEAIDTLKGIDDRVGRDYVRLVALLADNQLRSRWEPLDQEVVTVPAERADRVLAGLRSETEPESEPIEVTGFLFQLDAKKHDFKIQPDEGSPITGSYDDSLVGELRDSWRHRVVAEVTRTRRRFTYATHPHKTDYELERIVERLELVDD